MLTLGHSHEDIVLVLSHGVQFDLAWKGKDPKSAGGIVETVAAGNDSIKSINNNSSVTQSVGGTIGEKATKEKDMNISSTSEMRQSSNSQLDSSATTLVNASNVSNNSNIVLQSASEPISGTTMVPLKPVDGGTGTNLIEEFNVEVDGNHSNSADIPTSTNTRIFNTPVKDSKNDDAMNKTLSSFSDITLSTTPATTPASFMNEGSSNESPDDRAESPLSKQQNHSLLHNPIPLTTRAPTEEQGNPTGDKAGPRMETRRRFEEAVRSR